MDDVLGPEMVVAAASRGRASGLLAAPASRPIGRRLVARRRIANRGLNCPGVFSMLRALRLITEAVPEMLGQACSQLSL